MRKENEEKIAPESVIEDFRATQKHRGLRYNKGKKKWSLVDFKSS